ncbi:outer membrane lipid asymmetry maintenance protein MlaD [Alkalilimnicola ehrlichii]|uniref:Outer membrane lipid asymmetry maintenance protein MlaD n=1 Tax=Alkalilimnicola ehrlichii TaxID=351052 RepID=A0A3E0WXY9_9GAMM|nr:outer membrane lipid asymmetry maintenance protein MlaD [Alkalilimnicola ehrlichii]RFA30294.1 outer membrane lipid asymmetry maintenance protein MlaD [Alkalilimnicola ehrlichii]RFA37874.1 outer membrane lipid asymmetry maintenance protein MlaD [Alkalilimnicola ehrlichii]
MQTSRVVEIWVGIFVALGLAALLGLAVQVSNLTEFRQGPTYELTASFRNIGNLKPRAPVTVGGVRIGRVASIELNPETWRADVVLEIDARFQGLPAETDARIMTAGLLGEQYIGLTPGAPGFGYLEDGDEIEYTQPALVLEDLIGTFMVRQIEGE